MTFENLKISTVEPGIRVIQISRPTVLNALNFQTMAELQVAVEDANSDPAIRVVILTGEGEKAFIAGADIAEMQKKTTSEAVLFSQKGHRVTRLLELMNKPTIAAVNGFALGGGAEFAMACDFIIASENAVFGQPEVMLGVIPGFGGTFRLIKYVGLPMAKELIFSGRKIKSDEALRLGLVNHVVPLANLMPKAIEVAKAISLNSLGAVQKAKDLLNEFSETSGLNYKMDSEAQEFGALFGQADQVEGMNAFLDKRKPKFQGLES